MRIYVGGRHSGVSVGPVLATLGYLIAFPFLVPYWIYKGFAALGNVLSRRAAERSRLTT